MSLSDDLDAWKLAHPDADPIDAPLPDYMGQYVLDEHGEPRPARTLREWAEFIENPDHKRLAWTDVGGRVHVSTIFLGIDHSFGMGRAPVLWETMIFWNHTVTAEHKRFVETEGEAYAIEGTGEFYEYHPDLNGYQERYTSRSAALKGHTRAVNVALRVLQELDAKR